MICLLLILRTINREAPENTRDCCKSFKNNENIIGDTFPPWRSPRSQGKKFEDCPFTKIQDFYVIIHIVYDPK